MLNGEESKLKITLWKQFPNKAALVASGLILSAFSLVVGGNETTVTSGSYAASVITIASNATSPPISVSSGSVTVQNKQNQRQNMKVELDAFSGRPNPTWNLTPDEVTVFVKLISKLNLSRQPLDEGGLGYRGFIIYNTSDTTENIPTEIRVYNGVIRITDGGQVKHYEDNNRQLEHWLEEQSRQHGYGDIINWGKGSSTP